MKRKIMRISVMVIVILSCLCGVCHADLIDTPRVEPWVPTTEPEPINIIPIILIGFAVIAIVTVAVIVLVKNGKKKELENT